MINKEEYCLWGTSYLSDGLNASSEITTGTKEHCKEVMRNIEGTGEYWDMSVFKQSELGLD